MASPPSSPPSRSAAPLLQRRSRRRSPFSPPTTRATSTAPLFPSMAGASRSDAVGAVRSVQPISSLGALQMTTTVDHEASTSPRGGIKPREQAPELAVNLVRGGRWRLDEQQPENFTMVVFYRGLHCPGCRAQLSELNRRLDELSSRGITVIAISGDTHKRAQRTAVEWRLDRLAIGYGLSEETARSFGLFLSR